MTKGHSALVAIMAERNWDQTTTAEKCKLSFCNTSHFVRARHTPALVDALSIWDGIGLDPHLWLEAADRADRAAYTKSIATLVRRGVVRGSTATIGRKL